METPEQLRANAAEFDELARTVSYARDKQRCLERAEELRRRADDLQRRRKN